MNEQYLRKPQALEYVCTRNHVYHNYTMYPRSHAPSLKNALSLLFPFIFSDNYSYLAGIYLTLCAIGNENLHDIT